MRSVRLRQLNLFNRTLPDHRLGLATMATVVSNNEIGRSDVLKRVILNPKNRRGSKSGFKTAPARSYLFRTRLLLLI